MLSPSALEELCTYGWPGNVRELQNCIERAVILCDADSIQPRHLNLSFRLNADSRAEPSDGPPPPADPWTQIDLSGTMNDAIKRLTAEIERRKLERALKEAAGNKERAAEALQISYRVFLQKQKEYGLTEN
jgi:DNA-binding NtrC family response regulator